MIENICLIDFLNLKALFLISSKITTKFTSGASFKKGNRIYKKRIEQFKIYVITHLVFTSKVFPLKTKKESIE